MKLGSSIRRRRNGGGPSFSLSALIPKRFRGKNANGKRTWAFLKDPAVLGLLFLLAGIGFGGGYLISTRIIYPLPPPPGDLSPVPDLAGLGPEEAMDSLRVGGLFLGAVDSLNHPSVPLGRIVGQSPLPGQLALSGDTVSVTLSIGLEQRPIPDVLRLAGDRAEVILSTAGFVVMVDSVDSDEPRGSVVDMDPEPGTEATALMEVYLSLSKGPTEFGMPSLLGLSEEDARSVLDSLGLVIEDVETRFRFGRDQGLVVEQEPPADALVGEGTPVRLVVGRRGQ
jgi:beta-lactam-binding protein with PASTA domain